MVAESTDGYNIKMEANTGKFFEETHIDFHVVFHSIGVIAQHSGKNDSVGSVAVLCLQKKTHLSRNRVFYGNTRNTLDRNGVCTYNIMAIGAWRSLVSRLVRVQEAPGSNPGAPTMESRLVHARRLFIFVYGGSDFGTVEKIENDADHLDGYVRYTGTVCPPYFCIFR